MPDEPAPAARILIVEDDGIIARHLQVILRAQGHRVVAALGSGEAALAAAERAAAAREPLDLALMDINLDGDQDGIAVARLLRDRHGLPVVFLTAYADDRLLDRAAAADSFGYVLKPFEDRSLAATVRLALHKGRLEKRLAASEERYRAVMEQVSHGILLLDPASGRIVEANPAAQALLGYSAAELAGLPPEQAPQQTGPQHWRRPDGSLAPVEISSSLISFAGQQLRCLVLHDLSLGQASEAALSYERDLLHALMDHLPDTVYFKDLQSRFTRINRAQARMLGVANPQDAIGRTDADFFNPELAHLGLTEEQELLRSGRPITDRIEYNPTPSGQPRWLSATKVPLTDAEGRIIGLVGVSRDVTERRVHERELQAIADLGAALRSLLDRSKILPVAAQHVAEIFGALAVALERVDAVSGAIVTEIATGAWSEWQDLVTDPGKGISSRAVRSGQIYVTNGLSRDPWFAWPGHTGGLEAMMCLPLIVEQQVTGLLWVGRMKPFVADDVRLVNSVADLIAATLQRARLLEDSQRRAEQIAAVNVLGQALAETFDLAEIYGRLARGLARLLPGSDGMALAYYLPEADGLDYVVLDGVMLNSPDRPAAVTALAEADPRREALHSRRPVLVAGGDQWLNLDAAANLLAPLLAKGEVTGLLQVYSAAAGRFGPHEAELLAIVANAASSAIENARLFAETERRLQYVQALHGIDQAISASLDLRVALEVVLDQVMTQLHVDAALVLLYNAPLQALEFGAERGFHARGIERQQLRLGEGPSGRAALERATVAVPAVPAEDETGAWATLLAEEEVQEYYAVPLVAKGEVQGVLDIFQRGRLVPDAEWLDFLLTLAGEAAIAIDNAALFQGLQRSNLELALAYDATIEGWSRALDLRDRETEGHTQRVTELTERLARVMGLSPAELVHVRRGALLHDMGKMGIPDHILLKPGPLTDDEWVIMRQHPTYAYDMLTPISYLRRALDIPYCHHEKWDGTGYPRRLKGEAIPLPARLFAIVDVWDALRSDRPYRSAWPAERVRAYLREQTGKHFDPHVVECFETLEI
jgi:PAS domain S-box-containing protein